MDGSVYGLWGDGENTVPPFGRVEKNKNTKHLSKVMCCDSHELLCNVCLKRTGIIIFECQSCI